VKDNLFGAVGRLVIFVLVCSLGFVAMLLIFAGLRFQGEKTYRAVFTDVSGLKQDQFVRIAGVEVGQVKKITLQPNSLVMVEFSADNSVTLTEGTRVAIRWADVFGGRYLSLEDGAGGLKRLNPGDSIPTDRTLPALDLDSLIGGFRPLFRALDPDQVNALTGQLIAAFQGQGTTVNSFLAQTAAVTSTLADRDELIGQVIGNLNAVLGSLGGQSSQLDKAVTSLSDLVKGLADRKSDISNSVAYTNAAAGTVADLLQQARTPAKKVVTETDRTAGTVLADHEYFDNLLKTLPDSYQILARQGAYGDFINFYLCDLILKMNGKGGQPVYVKVAGQSSGRCAPR
jgi:phospholipid/cholesterol/gamma-HCH transport system substrate-binding protein